MSVLRSTDNGQDADTQIGGAFDVEKVLPELVYTDYDGYKSIAYGKLTAVLVEAVKELERQNDQKQESWITFFVHKKRYPR